MWRCFLLFPAIFWLKLNTEALSKTPRIYEKENHDKLFNTCLTRLNFNTSISWFFHINNPLHHHLTLHHSFNLFFFKTIFKPRICRCDSYTILELTQTKINQISRADLSLKFRAQAKTWSCAMLWSAYDLFNNGFWERFLSWQPLAPQ